MTCALNALTHRVCARNTSCPSCSRHLCFATTLRGVGIQQGFSPSLPEVLPPETVRFVLFWSFIGVRQVSDDHLSALYVLNPQRALPLYPSPLPSGISAWVLPLAVSALHLWVLMRHKAGHASQNINLPCVHSLLNS